MQNIKHSRFSLILLGIIGAGIVMLVVGLLILQHERAQTKVTKGEVAALKAKYDERKKNAENIDDLRMTLANLEARLSQLDKNLIAYEYIPTYLQEIQATTGRTISLIKNLQPGERKNLDLSNSPFADKSKTDSKAVAGKPAAPADKTSAESEEGNSPAAKAKKAESSPYQVMNINLNVQGSYASMLRLLHEFSKFRKMIYVRSINLTQQRGTQSQERTLQGRFETYAIITPDQYKPDVQTSQPQKVQPKNIAEGGKP